MGTETQAGLPWPVPHRTQGHGNTRSQKVAEETYRCGDVTIRLAPAESLYAGWPSPVCIMSDGPYGLSGYPGDLDAVGGLVEWYRPHVEAWTARATAQTTLWFWNSELGWATVHPLLAGHGWEYRACHIWDKGIGHVAGNANTKTLRKFPVTTEVCVQYVMPATFDGKPAQDWLREEWRRSGLPFRLSNEACGVANAATRKYLSPDRHWYMPPPEEFGQLAAYANEHGDPAGRPYFSEDGKRPLSASEWGRKRAKFNCPVGTTNVWRRPHVVGAERISGRHPKGRFKSLHGSQKPTDLIGLIVAASTDRGDVVWEPFGGLCPTAYCSFRSGRACYSAEVIPEFYRAATARIRDAQHSGFRATRRTGTSAPGEDGQP